MTTDQKVDRQLAIDMGIKGYQEMKAAMIAVTERTMLVSNAPTAGTAEIIGVLMLYHRVRVATMSKFGGPRETFLDFDELMRGEEFYKIFFSNTAAETNH